MQQAAQHLVSALLSPSMWAAGRRHLKLHVVLQQGDLIPWTVGQQFQDADFPRLSGARIVRIAVHPSVTRAG